MSGAHGERAAREFTADTERAYAARTGRRYDTCETCGSPVIGWVCFPPVQVEYCRVCTTSEEAFADVAARWEIGRQASLN